ncbi:Epsin-3 [Camellia lanceoleosa]|uniref:Epsin-3 n=1 Tax=Camellia lanceoleosa TaxID=1840588 RepID=A0ACC0GVI4_9ERIC|nr:Epsin-3 [Camellia lanceoleosa]
MGNLFLDQIKKQASSFLHEKYKTVKLVLTDVTEAELLAEDATNNDPCTPNARTMNTIAQAAFDIDNYWGIVDVLHRRLYSIDWKEWRQSYKSLVLLDFLLTHGPEDFAEEFKCDYDVIQELGMFEHRDKNGIDWGMNMQKLSERILNLLQGGETLKQARLKALKITKEIQGFGNLMVSPSASSSSSSSSSEMSGTSSFGSCSTSSPAWNEIVDETNKYDQHPTTKQAIAQGQIQDKKFSNPMGNKNIDGSHVWNCPPIEETDSLLDSEDENEEKEKSHGFIRGICSKLVGNSPSKYNGEKVSFRSISDVGMLTRKNKIDCQFSSEY